MKSANITRGFKMKVLAFFLVLFCSTVSAIAETVEVFLLEEHRDSIENLHLSREQGHRLVFYYLDAELKIEEMLTKEVSGSLDRVFKEVTKGLSKQQIQALGDDKIEALVMQKIEADKEFQQQAEVMKSVSNDPDITEALARAEEDKQYAISQGIAMNELPAVLFQDKKFTHVKDFSEVSPK